MDRRKNDRQAQPWVLDARAGRGFVAWTRSALGLPPSRRARHGASRKGKVWQTTRGPSGTQGAEHDPSLRAGWGVVRPKTLGI